MTGITNCYRFIKLCLNISIKVIGVQQIIYLLRKNVIGGANMSTTDFGLKVRTELLKRNMTNKQLAEMLEISCAYLSDILRGRRDAFEQKKRIAKILEIKEEVKS